MYATHRYITMRCDLAEETAAAEAARLAAAEAAEADAMVKVAAVSTLTIAQK